ALFSDVAIILRPADGRTDAEPDWGGVFLLPCLQVGAALDLDVEFASFRGECQIPWVPVYTRIREVDPQGCRYEEFREAAPQGVVKQVGISPAPEVPEVQARVLV